MIIVVDPNNCEIDSMHLENISSRSEGDALLCNFKVLNLAITLLKQTEFLNLRFIII